MPGKELFDLCSRLRGEKLFVNSELEHLQELNNEVGQKLNELIQIAWISRQQQLTLSKLVHSHVDATPQNSCRHVKYLEKTKFVDSNRKLGANDAVVCDLFRVLLHNTQVVAEFLCAVDTTTDLCSPQNSPTDVAHTIFSGLYGCCVFAADEKLVAETLIHLMRAQLAQNQNPRRVLRRGNCAFSRLYRLLSEGLFSAKLFLTCALHEPIMDVLSQDELFLDIDPSKAVIRFPLQERLKRFGEEGTTQYKENLAKYRKIIVGKLVTLSQKFINSLKSSLHCFPPVLTILVRRLHEMLRSTGKITEAETSLICIDLIFTYFICPAITKPEPLGIIDDTPISYIARFNLMQIGQILQSLAVFQFETLDPKLMDLYGQFDRECVGGLVQSILSTSENLSLDDIYPSNNDFVQRQVALVTVSELDSLVNLLRRCQNSTAGERWPEVKDVLRRLPERFIVADFSTARASPDQNGHRRSTANSPSRKKTLKLPRPRVPHIHRSPSGDRIQIGSDENANVVQNALSPEEAAIEVLMIPIVAELDAPLGLLAEEKYLATTNKTEKEQQNSNADVNIINEKRTRFDLESLGTGTSDQLDASSDDQESVSSSLEGIGNPVLNDNFSDVDGLPISANVSGRGSPNISGRDTPLSLHTEQQEEEHEPEDTPSSPSGVNKTERKLPELPDTARKENRADIEEKFGKFELPQPHRGERHRDETHSLVSDSWSTDVLASDSEFGLDLQNLAGGNIQQQSLPDIVPGQQDIPRLDLIAEEIVVTGSGAGVGRGNPHLEVGAGCDRSDTWSVDATASDSEAEPIRNEDRMKEFDESVPGSIAGSTDQYGANVGATPAEISASAPPEILFNVDNKTFDEKQSLRRQSSGSSFLSKSEADADDHVGSFGDKYEPPPATDPFLPPLPPGPAKNPSSTVGGSDAKWSVTAFDADVRPSDNSPESEMCSERQSLGRLSFLIDDNNKVLAGAHHGQIQNKPLKAQNSTASIGSNVETSVSSSAETDKKKDLQATGAIPKKHRSAIVGGPSSQAVSSVTNRFGNGFAVGSFDKDDKKQQRNFFKNFKLSNLKSKVRRSQTDHLLMASYSNTNDPNLTLPGIPHSSSAYMAAGDQSNETGEQILAKYRRSGTASNNGAEVAPLVDLSDVVPTGREIEETPPTTVARPYYDSTNVVNCQAFIDIKRKLRMVLSSVDVGTLPSGLDGISNAKNPKESELVQFLNVLLAEALNTRQKFLSAQLQEVLRCLTLFDSKGVKKLMRALHEEHRHRSAYLNYLQQSRHSLLQIRSCLNKLINKVQCEQSLSVEWLVEFCARLYLEQRWDRHLRNFVEEFQKLEVQDEKTEFVERFLSTLDSAMLKDVMWQSASEDQLTYAQLSVERCAMAQVYIAALYPNGDADVLRDQVFHDTINRLSNIITPSHKDLRIAPEYHAECPWPLAQAEIAIINAYKTPRDKLGCVLRCCETIVHLLRVSRASGAPAADDVIPVLVFVLIKANPPALLSTIQYINGFYGKRLQGEEAYWWTQFCSSVEFIKMMADYNSI